MKTTPLPKNVAEASDGGLRTTDLFGVFVTAKIKGEIYPLQGWVISESPLRIKCSGGDEYDCEGPPTAVINPPDRTPASMVCECENPGPHMKPGAGGKFCAVCGWDIPPNAKLTDGGRETQPKG
jgi:hypothetical protein